MHLGEKFLCSLEFAMLVPYRLIEMFWVKGNPKFIIWLFNYYPTWLAHIRGLLCQVFAFFLNILSNFLSFSLSSKAVGVFFAGVRSNVIF